MLGGGQASRGRRQPPAFVRRLDQLRRRPARGRGPRGCTTLATSGASVCRRQRPGQRGRHRRGARGTATRTPGDGRPAPVARPASQAGREARRPSGRCPASAASASAWTSGGRLGPARLSTTWRLAGSAELDQRLDGRRAGSVAGRVLRPVASSTSRGWSGCDLPEPGGPGGRGPERVVLGLEQPAEPGRGRRRARPSAARVAWIRALEQRRRCREAAVGPRSSARSRTSASSAGPPSAAIIVRTPSSRSAGTRPDRNEREQRLDHLGRADRLEREDQVPRVAAEVEPAGLDRGEPVGWSSRAVSQRA